VLEPRPSGYAQRAAAARARAVELYKRLSELASRRGELDRAAVYDRRAERYQLDDESQLSETLTLPKADSAERCDAHATVDEPRIIVEENPRVGW
jgi:hypothetical protein